MRSIAAVLVLASIGWACTSTPAHQASRWPAIDGKWTKLGEGPSGGLYYDSSSVKGPAETKRVTVLIDYADKTIREEREVLSSQYFVTVDCVNRVLVTDTESGYSGRMGSGKPLFAAFYNRRFQPPGWNPQLFRGIYDVVCNAQG